jgi:hypothetical protein
MTLLGIINEQSGTGAAYRSDLQIPHEVTMITMIVSDIVHVLGEYSTGGCL